MRMFAIWTDALTRLADLTGIAYPPSALFVLGSAFILAVLLHYSTVISRLSDQNGATKRVAMLELRLEESTQGARAPEADTRHRAARLRGLLLLAQLGERALPTEVDVTDAASLAGAVRGAAPGATCTWPRSPP